MAHTAVYAEQQIGSTSQLLGYCDVNTELRWREVYQVAVQIGKPFYPYLDKPTEEYLKRVTSHIELRFDTYEVGYLMNEDRRYEVVLIARPEHEPWRLNNWTAAYHG